MSAGLTAAVPDDVDAGRGRRRTPRLALTCLAGGALLAVLQRVDGDSIPLIALTAATPVLAVAPLAATVVAALRRHWWTALAGVVVLGALLQVRGPFLAAAPAGTAASAGVRLTVMTVNIDRGGADAADVVRLVRERRVDVLAVQELTRDAVGRLRTAGLDGLLPSSDLQPGEGPAGTGLWSRYPLTARDPHAGLFFALPSATLAVPVAGGGSRSVLVATAHPLAPQAGGRAWGREQAGLAAWAGAQDGPVVLAGDLNATWDHARWRSLLASGLADAAAQTGELWQPTWPSDSVVPPVVAIDHVLTGGGLRATSLDAVHVAGTDHRALVAQVAG